MSKTLKLKIAISDAIVPGGDVAIAARALPDFGDDIGVDEVAGDVCAKLGWHPPAIFLENMYSHNLL